MKKLLSNGALFAALSAPLLSTPAQASDIDALQTLGQAEFKLLTEDMGAALSYKSLSPAAALGVTGFDLGLSVTGTSLKSVAIWEKSTGGDSIPNTLPVPMLRVAKGLPLNIDVGAFYLQIPSTNIRLYGAEARWAFVEGGVATPAISLHATYSKVTGVDQLNLKTTSMDLSISKGFAVITPYGGIGQVWTNATPVNVPLLKSASITQTKYFVGLNFNLGLPNLAFEADQTGGITSYGAKFGLRW
ncbi:MAG: hypothetical protein AB7Q04_10620 [Steroidobacteraceae bacterium]